MKSLKKKLSHDSTALGGDVAGGGATTPGAGTTPLIGSTQTEPGTPTLMTPVDPIARCRR